MSEVLASLPPYPGLRAFARDESMLFFGRENCVDTMIERLAATRFLAVLGASGSGKSSLVRTGLFDGLELGFFARAGSRWRIAETHPGGAPMRNLAAALAAAVGAPDEAGDLEELLRRGRRSIIEWVAEARLQPGENLLILVDQFEELFRYADYAAREEAESFVALLLETIRAGELPIYVVITMRSEYLGACALISGLAEQVNTSFYLTPRMSREECRQAIEGPAAVLGFEIEPALTNRILNDMAGFAPWQDERGVAQGQILSRRADQLPLMQHLLNRLWLRTQGGTDATEVTLTVQDYETVGGLIGALDAHGGEVLGALSPADQALAPSVFRALISGPDPTNAVRRPCRFGAMQEEAEQREAGGGGAVTRIVEAFRANGCNFLQPPPSVPLAADALIDISHESLIRQWSRLSDWLREEATAEANWRRLLMQADRHGAGEGELLSGRDLNSLADWWDQQHPNTLWAARHGGGFEEIQAFLEQSRAVQRDALERARAEREEAEARKIATERQRRTRLLGTLAVVTGALVLTIAVSMSLWIGFQTANAQLEVARAQTKKARHEASELAAKIQDAQQNLEDKMNEAKAQEQQVSSLQLKLKTAASILQGTMTNLPDMLDYCERNQHEKSCSILLNVPGGGVGADRRNSGGAGPRPR